MEIKVSSPRPGLSSSDCVSDPEEKEISDNDDDDRNHKHRRRETRSQSLERRDALDQVLTRPYRKRNKPYENVNLYGEGNSQSSEIWKNYNISHLEKDLSSKFEKKYPGLASFSRVPLDLNQRIRLNQSFSGNPGPGRGRGSSWSQRDSRFSSVDIAPQLVQQGSVPPNFFAGRGLPNVSNAQSAPWNAFGLVPGMMNGSLDTMRPLGLHGTLRPPINSSLNIGIPRQRCRDFEERGFCLRGDMCPMEHGVNRIVVEDVQSLSQFNLPVSLPSAHMLVTPAGPGPVPATSAPSSTMMSNKGVHGKSSKPAMADDGLGLNGAFVGSVDAGGADFYDPDQPLWTNNCAETATALLALNPAKVDETEPLLSTESSGCHHVGSDNEHLVIHTGTSVESQSTSLSLLGRIGISKSRSKSKEKMDAIISSSNCKKSDAGEDGEQWYNAQGTPHQGNRVNVDETGPQAKDSSRTPSDTGRNIRKPYVKAVRTLAVNGIPQKNNKKEILFSHFRKFGEVVDIYIPLNGERAFVQFSKREEAKAALKAPDAVMGNRFIKLWWANRDNIRDNGISSSNGVPLTRGVAVASVPPQSSVANRRNDTLHSATSQGTVAHASVGPVPPSDYPKPVVTNGPIALPPSQKKLESLELLKEELRKKQEMLDKKRNEFRRQLDNLEKKGTGLKVEAASEQASKKHKASAIVDVANSSASISTPGTVLSPQHAEVVTDGSKAAENVVPCFSKSSSIVAVEELSSIKYSTRPLVPVGAPFTSNRFKLDNRPTAFKLIAPVPTGLLNVATLKAHFSLYGDLSNVELEDLQSQEDECNDDSETSKCSARISYRTRLAAERAFLNGKCWEGHNLQFMWLASNNLNNSSKDIESQLSSSKGPLDANIQPMEETSTGTDKEAASGNGESGDAERKIDAKHTKLEGNFQSSSTATSG